MASLKVNGAQVRGASIVSLAADTSVDFATNEANTIILATKDSRGYVEWYSAFVGSKQLAMLKSGSSKHYTFLSPFTAKTVSSINNVEPDTLGNISILGSKITDVSEPNADKPVILVSRLSVTGNTLEQLEEIYLFTMRLYEATNRLTQRLLVFDPSSWEETEDRDLGKLGGTLMNYQANVARWNFLVWKSSYTQVLEASRQNLALSLGYSCVTCRILGAEISTVIEKVDAQPTEVEDRDSAHCLTIYRQSISDNRQDKSSPVSTKITKYFGGEEVEIFGFGMDSRYDNWDKIVIEQSLPAMEQSDKYSELFSLSLGMGVTAYVYLSKDDDPSNSKNTFKVATTWKVTTTTGEVLSMTKSEIIQVAAVNAKNLDEEEQEGSEE